MIAGATAQACRGLVVLDRDGVLVREVLDHVTGKTRSPRSLREFVVSDDAAVATESLHSHGFRLAVATNQPDLARGWLTESELDAMHARLRASLPGVGTILYCPHDNDDACGCRKPAPGLLLEAMARAATTEAVTWMIGDRWTDVLAARRAGIRSVLLRSESSWQATSSGEPPEGLTPDHVVGSLRAACDLIIPRVQVKSPEVVYEF